MIKRGLIIDGFDTAVDGRMTMTKFAVETPDFVQDLQEIPGMDGALDFSEAAAGRTVYKTRKLTATFELSAENHAWREQLLDQMIGRIHGKRCEIYTPDVEKEYLTGRVSIKKNFNRLSYAEIALTAVCDPFYEENVEQMKMVSLLKRADNEITAAIVSYQSAYSSCSGSVSGDTDSTTVTLHASPDDVGKVACFRLDLAANTEYYVSGRVYGRGKYHVSTSQYATDFPDKPSPVITTGDNGYIYLFITRLQSTGVVNLDDVVVVPTSKVSRINFGQQPVLPRYTRPGAMANASRVIVSVNGRSYVHTLGSTLRTELYSGELPVLAFRTDNGSDAAEFIYWRKKRL